MINRTSVAEAWNASLNVRLDPDIAAMRSSGESRRLGREEVANEPPTEWLHRELDRRESDRSSVLEVLRQLVGIDDMENRRDIEDIVLGSMIVADIAAGGGISPLISGPSSIIRLVRKYANTRSRQKYPERYVIRIILGALKEMECVDNLFERQLNMPMNVSDKVIHGLKEWNS